MATIGNGGLSAGHGDLDYIGGTTRVSSVQLFPYADSSVSVPLLGYSPTWDGLQFIYKPATTMTPLYAGIDGTNNDYDPGDEYQQLQLHNISGADATLTGMARGVLGKLVTIQWNGDHSLIIRINNAGSQMPNRFYAYSSSTDIVMKSGQSIVLVYGYLSAVGNTGWLILGQLNDAPLNSTAATTLTVSSVAGSGTSLSPARQDHVHAITSSSNPGAAAAILATDASGYIRVVRIGAGIAPGYSVDAYGTMRVTGTADGTIIVDGTAGGEFQFTKGGANRWAFGTDVGVANDDLNYYSYGASAVVLSLGYTSGGITVGSPTGGNKGAGTINAAADIYKNGTAYTNPAYALEHWATGQIITHADKAGAVGYKRPTLAECESYIRKHYELPGHSESFGLFDGSEWLLEKVEELTTYVIELSHEVERLRKN